MKKEENGELEGFIESQDIVREIRCSRISLQNSDEQNTQTGTWQHNTVSKGRGKQTQKLQDVKEDVRGKYREVCKDKNYEYWRR